MPSGFLGALPTDVVLDEGVLSINGSTFGASRGGISTSFADEIQNIMFDGKRSDVALLDRYISHGAYIAGRFIDLSASQLAVRLNQPSVAGTPYSASALFAIGQYASNVRATWLCGAGGVASVAVLLTYARCEKWSVVGGTKDAAEIEAEFRCDLDLRSVTTTDLAPYAIEVTR